MKRTFPTKNLIWSEFQSFAIQKKSLKNQAYLRCQENLFCMIMISENSAVKKKRPNAQISYYSICFKWIRWMLEILVNFASSLRKLYFHEKKIEILVSEYSE